MKAFVIIAAVVALGQAWVILPGQPPIGIPGSRPLPPGISPEVPVLPPKPELPGPLQPNIHPPVDSHILNFPSDEEPQIRVHVNIKHEKGGHADVVNRPNYRPVRSVLPPLNGPRPLPDIDNRPAPIYPEIGFPLPGFPEINLPHPEVPGNPEAEVPQPILPPKPEADAPVVFVYPNPQNQLVKLRVQYNKPAENVDIPAPEWSPYKIDWNPPQGGVDPIHPWVPENPTLPGDRPIIPMPMPPPGGQKQPEVELFLDIGEPDQYE